MSDKSKDIQSAPDTLVGTQLGDYVIQALIGEGGMAHVYEGYDPKLGRRAAIKVIEIKHGEDDETTQRFIREARAIASLDHPNIVSVYQFGEGKNLYYLAMKLIEGKTLLSIMKALRKQKKYMPNDQVVAIISEVASAIDYAHSRSLIHRDIKPSNIMLTQDNRAILMDFGLTMDSSLNNTMGTAFGTPRYIAPEQAIASHKATPQSDIYSLGVVLYELIANQTPFNDDSPMSLALAHISKVPPDLQSVRPDILHPVQTVVLKALEKRSEDRWQTGLALAEALRKAYDGIEPNVKLSRAPIPKPEEYGMPNSIPVKTDRRQPRPARKTTQLVLPDETMVDAAAANPVPQPITEQNFNTEAKKRTRRNRLPIFLGVFALVVIVGIAVILLTTSPKNNPPSVGVAATNAASPGIRLIYGSDALTIYNASSSVAKLENIVFKRDDNVTQVFEAWRFGENTQNSLQPGGCFRIRYTAFDDSTTPLICGPNNKNLQRSIGWNAPFWLMNDKDKVDTFSVVGKDHQVIKQCSMRLNTCEFSLP